MAAYGHIATRSDRRDGRNRCDGRCRCGRLAVVIGLHGRYWRLRWKGRIAWTESWGSDLAAINLAFSGICNRGDKLAELPGAWAFGKVPSASGQDGDQQH